MPVTTLTKKMLFEEEDGEKENGRFVINYHLIMEENSVGNYHLEITYTEVI